MPLNQAPRGFYRAAFHQAPAPMLAVEQQTGLILMANQAFAELAGVASPEDVEQEPLGRWLAGRSGGPLRLNTEREATLKAVAGPVAVRIALGAFSRQGTALQLLCVMPEERSARETGRFQQALEREREKALAAARVGLRAYQLTAKLRRATGLFERIAGTLTLDELCSAAADYLTAEDGMRYAGAAFLLVEGDQLLLQHSTFPQPGRRFDRRQDHRYARMARGEAGPLTEDGECLVPMRVGLDVVGYLVLRFHEEERALFEDSSELRDGQLALVELLAAQLGLLHRKLQLAEAEGGAARDALTGLPEKSHFERTLESELQRARRYERPLTVLLLAPDTPAAGRGAGPRAADEPLLVELSRFLVEAFRAIDLICRHELETFGILLPETSLAQAKAKAESLRGLVAAHFAQSGENGERAPLTISIGLAGRSWETTDWRELLDQGSQALQEARRLGGDAVCFWGETIGRVPRKLATPLS